MGSLTHPPIGGKGAVRPLAATCEQHRLFALVWAERSVIRAAMAANGVDTAEEADAFQAALALAWEQILAGRFAPLPGVEPTLSARRWLFWTARHALQRDLLRAEGRDVGDIAGPDPVPRLEARDALRVATYQLNRMERALLAGVGEGRTFAEIAEEARIPFGTAATRVRTVRTILRKRGLA